MARKVYLQFAQENTDWPLGAKKRRTEIWTVESSDGRSYLGTILWRSGWRRYVFEPASHTIFDAACLGEVATFIEGLMAKRRT